MDLLRSCYTTQFRFHDGQIPQDVTWYRAAASAQFFPKPHAYASRIWDTEDDWGPVGEVRPAPRPWSNGARPRCAIGRLTFLGTFAQYSGEESGVTAAGEPMTGSGIPGACCCSQDGAVVSSQDTIDSVVVQGCGGLALGDPAAPFDPCIPYPTLYAHCDPGAACTAVAGKTIPCVFDPYSGFWIGSTVVLGGVFRLLFQCTLDGFHFNMIYHFESAVLGNTAPFLASWVSDTPPSYLTNPALAWPNPVGVCVTTGQWEINGVP